MYPRIRKFVHSSRKKNIHKTKNSGSHSEMSEQDCKKNLQKLENAEVDGVAVQNAEGNPKIGGKRTQFGGFQLNKCVFSDKDLPALLQQWQSLEMSSASHSISAPFKDLAHMESEVKAQHEKNLCDELKLKLKAKLEKFLEGNNKETLQTSQIKPKSETSAISGLISIPSRKEYSEIVCEEPYGKPGFYDNTVIDTWLDPAKSDCKGNIAIVGQSQIGKTQLLKKILLDVKDKYDYVFLVTLKSFDLSKSGFVLKLLTCNKSDVPYIDNVGDQQEADCKKVINNLIIGSLNEENPIKICIVFDHWENVTLFNKQESNSNVSFLSKAPFHDFLQRILEEGFANSKLLMLLNPWQFYQLKHKVKYIIFVEGINYADQEQLVSNKALSCTRAGCKLKACCGCVIKKHERNQCSICCHCHEDNCHHELQSLCFVPENCKKLRSFLRYPQSTVVHQAFLIFFDNIVKKYLNQINWYEIGMFAWKSYKNKDFTFHELELLKLPDTVINILFNCKSENLLDTLSFDRIFFFSHVLLHEFLAALGLLSFPIQNFKDELKAYKAAFVDGSFAVVCEFMSEICKDSSLMRFLCNRIDLKHDNFVELVEVLPTSVIPKHGLT